MNDQLNDYMDLIMYRKQIVDLYFSIYSDFQRIDGYDLDSTNDISLDFVNCTICGAKKNILQNRLGENYVMLQPCLRNNHIEALQTIDGISNYMSFFTMLGGYYYIADKETWVEQFNHIVLRQFIFFRKLYATNHIKLTIPSQYASFLPLSAETKGCLINNNCDIVFSETDADNLKWKYGINGVIGYGTRWEILGVNNRYVNCGNDIILFKNNEPIGIDFGSGLETVVSVKKGEENLLYSNIICADEVNEFCDNPLNEKLVDSLTSLICIIFFKKYKNFRVKYILLLYERIIGAITVINDIDNEQLIYLITIICDKLKIQDPNIIEQIIENIDKVKDHLQRITNGSFGDKIIENYDFENMSIRRNCYSLRKYFGNLSEIELLAIAKIKNREENYVKTKKIGNRRLYCNS